MTREDKCCRTCQWHIMQTNAIPSKMLKTTYAVSVDWFCNNHESEHFEEFTLYSDVCDKWKGGTT